MKHCAPTVVVGVLVVLLAGSCGGGGDGGGDGPVLGQVKTGISSQDDAWRVAMIIADQWNEAVNIHDTAGFLYTDHGVAGYVGGQVILNGIYIKEYTGVDLDQAWEFMDMALDYTDYQESEDYSSLTGRIEADGRIHYDSSGQDYSGTWEVQGALDLDPPAAPQLAGYEFDCNVEFYFQYRQTGTWSAVIRENGTDWYVNSVL